MAIMKQNSRSKKNKREALNLVEKPVLVHVKPLRKKKLAEVPNLTKETPQETNECDMRIESEDRDSTTVEIKKKQKKGKHVEHDAEVELKSSPKKKCKKKKSESVPHISEDGLTGKKRKLEDGEEAAPKKKKKKRKKSDDELVMHNNGFKDNSLCDSVSKKKSKRNEECNSIVDNSSGSKKKTKKVKVPEEGGDVEDACIDSTDNSRLEEAAEKNPNEVKAKKKSKKKDKAESIEEPGTPRKKRKKTTEETDADNPIEKGPGADNPHDELCDDLILNTTIEPPQEEVEKKPKKQRRIPVKRSREAREEIEDDVSEVNDQPMLLIGSVGAGLEDHARVDEGVQLCYKKANFSGVTYNWLKKDGTPKGSYKHLIKGDITLCFKDSNLHQIDGYGIKAKKS